MALNKKIASLLGVAWIAIAVHAETVTVTNTNVSGSGSLSAAIDDANADASLTNIVFDIAGGGNIVTGHHGWFPKITTPIIIDGANASGTVTLEGAAPNGPGAPVDGLEFDAGSEGSKVTNVTTEGFLNAIWVKADDVSISKSFFSNAFARAVKVENSKSVLLEKNSFQGDNYFSVFVNNSDNVALLGNDVKSGSVYVRDSRNIIVGSTGYGQGNSFDGNGGSQAAVHVVGRSTGVQVLNNTIQNQTLNAVSLEGVSNNTVGFNTFSNNKKSDIFIGGGAGNQVLRNQITGDALAREAGITVDGTNNLKVVGNTLDGARITVTGSNGATIGGLFQDGNTISNDAVGFSGSAAIILKNSNKIEVENNSIVDNASHGIIIDQNTSNSTIYANTIRGNGRSGIKAYSGVNNTFSQNSISEQGAAAGGGTNSISLLGDANNRKAAPVIDTIIRTDNRIDISGTAGAGDKIEVFVSPTPDFGSSLMTSADRFVTTAFAIGTSWAVPTPAHLLEGPAVLYFTATATDADGNTSKLAIAEKLVLVDGVAGINNVNVGETHRYEVEEFHGTNYQWWVGGDATIKSGKGSNKITVTFNQAGTTVPVTVGYTDPVKGWVRKTLKVSVK